MKYVKITFIPGAAGNFFCRCLNLLDNAHCFVRKNESEWPKTLQEKIDYLNYDTVVSRNFDQDSWTSWISFENELEWCRHLMPRQWIENASADTVLVWPDHPFAPLGSSDLTTVVGPDDQIFDFYIDPTGLMEWVSLNAFYKNSYIEVSHLVYGRKLYNNSTVHKIKLDCFLKDWEIFYNEFFQVCKIIGHNSLPQQTLMAIKHLHSQWQKTVLDPDRFEEFKKHIGFF